MDTAIAVNKMEDSVSVSSSKFANDSPSWETNKHLEEVDKCSAVGSVAQKKAYFEAQCKNLTAKKAEQEPDKDKKKGIIKARHLMDSEDQTRKDSLNDFNPYKSNGQSCANSIELENEAQNTTCKLKNVAEDMIESKDKSPLAEDVKDESCCRPATPELRESEEPIMVKEVEEVKELPQHVDEARATDEKEERHNAKLEKSTKSQKVTSAKKAVSSSGVKKSLTSSTLKSSVMPNSKLSRPTLSKSITPTPKALSKKEHSTVSTSPLISKRPTSVESRRVAPTSLHMSINFDPPSSERKTSTTMRKSLIMERMGDKDIVKRAFKPFTSKPSQASEILGKETNTRTSLEGTPKKTEGGNKPVKKSSPLSGQALLGKTPNSTRPNAVGTDKGDQGHKGSKKLEDKVNSKAAEKAKLQSKEKKEAEIKRQQSNYTTKTKPISAAFASKTSLHKSVNG